MTQCKSGAVTTGLICREAGHAEQWGGEGGCEPGLECRLSFLCPVFQYKTIKVIFGGFSSKTPDVFLHRKKKKSCYIYHREFSQAYL